MLVITADKSQTEWIKYWNIVFFYEINTKALEIIGQFLQL